MFDSWKVLEKITKNILFSRNIMKKVKKKEKKKKEKVLRKRKGKILVDFPPYCPWKDVSY